MLVYKECFSQMRFSLLFMLIYGIIIITTNCISKRRKTMTERTISAEIEQINFQLTEYSNFVSSEEYREGYTPESLKARRDFLYRQLQSEPQKIPPV